MSAPVWVHALFMRDSGCLQYLLVPAVAVIKFWVRSPACFRTSHISPRSPLLYFTLTFFRTLAQKKLTLHTQARVPYQTFEIMRGVISTKSLSPDQVVVVIGATYAASHALFLLWHFALRRFCSRSSSSWRNGLFKSLGVTHTVVFVVASLQHVLRAFVLQEAGNETEHGTGTWDASLILIYYESCVLSLFGIAIVAAVFARIFPADSPERCDETIIDASSLGDEDADELDKEIGVEHVHAGSDDLEISSCED